MNTTKSRLPNTEELAAAIRKLHIGGYAPSIAIFKAKHCNSDVTDRWALPGSILRNYGYERSAQGWAEMCHQLTGLISAERGYYMAFTYDTEKRQQATGVRHRGKPLQHGEPPPRKVWRVETLNYSFRRREYFRETIFIS